MSVANNKPLAVFLADQPEELQPSAISFSRNFLVRSIRQTVATTASRTPARTICVCREPYFIIQQVSPHEAQGADSAW
jgi:hypothetical protein